MWVKEADAIVKEQNFDSVEDKNKRVREIKAKLEKRVSFRGIYDLSDKLDQR